MTLKTTFNTTAIGHTQVNDAITLQAKDQFVQNLYRVSKVLKHLVGVDKIEVIFALR